MSRRAVRVTFEPEAILVDPLQGDARDGVPRAAVVANVLTSARLGIALLFPMIPAPWRLPALLAAAATECLDGWIARTWHATTPTGRVLDPVADKILAFSVLATLAADGSVAIWEVPLVAARDILVVGGVLYSLARDGWSGLRRMPPSLLGKLTTAGQYLWLLLVLLGVRSDLRGVVLAATSASGVAAGLAYLWRYPRCDS